MYIHVQCTSIQCTYTVQYIHMQPSSPCMSECSFLTSVDLPCICLWCCSTLSVSKKQNNHTVSQSGQIHIEYIEYTVRTHNYTVHPYKSKHITMIKVNSLEWLERRNDRYLTFWLEYTSRNVKYRSSLLSRHSREFTSNLTSWLRNVSHISMVRRGMTD